MPRVSVPQIGTPSQVSTRLMPTVPLLPAQSPQAPSNQIEPFVSATANQKLLGQAGPSGPASSTASVPVAAASSMEQPVSQSPLNQVEVPAQVVSVASRVSEAQPFAPPIFCGPIRPPVNQPTPQTSPSSQFLQPAHPPQVPMYQFASFVQPAPQASSSRIPTPPQPMPVASSSRPLQHRPSLWRSQRIPEIVDIGVPLDTRSHRRGSDDYEANLDIVMADLSDEDEDELNTNQRQDKGKGKHVPEYASRSGYTVSQIKLIILNARLICF
jgi:hypothetical protein